MKDTFDKVVMNEERQEEIRAGLMGKKRAKKTWIAPVTAAAAAVAVIMLVPGTRKAVVKAAETLYAAFTTRFNNLTVSVEETSFSGEGGAQIYKISTEYDFSNYEPWAQVKDGRLYFVLNGKSIDITDKCSATDVFRYEQDGENGYKTILFVGGTPDNYGWGQIIRNPNGDMVEGMAFVDDANTEPEWLKRINEKEVHSDFMMTLFSKDEIPVLVGKGITTMEKPTEN